MFKDWIARSLVLLALIATSIAAVPAWAIQILPGTSISFNVDFTGQAVPPPYSGEVDIQFHVQNVVLPNAFTIDFFDGLDDTGTLFTGFPSEVGLGGLDIAFGGGVGGFTQALDGVFSFEITGVSGSFDLIDLQARAFDIIDGVDTLVATIPATAVGEPSTPAVMLAGLIGLLALRRGTRGRLGRGVIALR